MTATIRGLEPDGRLTGPLQVPGSKSCAQRLLVMGALCDGGVRLSGVPGSEDVMAASNAVRALGAGVAASGARSLSIQGGLLGPGGDPGVGGKPRVVSVGESGTAARLVTAAAAFWGVAGSEVVVEGSGSLHARGSGPLLAALQQAGVRMEPLGPRRDGWPVRLHPSPPPPEVRVCNPVSSQEVTALLIALAARPGGGRLIVDGQIPSLPYVHLTRTLLEQFGVTVRSQGGLPSSTGGESFEVNGPLCPPPDPILVEPDASAAAVGLVAGCLSGGGVRIRGLTLGSPQGDVRIVEHLRSFGLEAGEDRGALIATGRPSRGAVLDLAGEPDLAPPLAALAGAAALRGHRSMLQGLETLPGKESSRIEVLGAGLAALGLGVRCGVGHLEVFPGADPGGEVLLDPHGDHRMAFAFALLGLVRRGVLVAGSDCVAKSWPHFWEDVVAAGARIRVP